MLGYRKVNDDVVARIHRAKQLWRDSDVPSCRAKRITVILMTRRIGPTESR